MRYCDFIKEYEKDKDGFFPINYEEVIYLMYYDFTNFCKTIFTYY